MEKDARTRVREEKRTEDSLMKVAVSNQLREIIRVSTFRKVEDENCVITRLLI